MYQKHKNRSHPAQIPARKTLSALLSVVTCLTALHFTPSATAAINLASNGYIDPTHASYGATPNDWTDDDRQAIQNAIDDALATGKAVYLKPGIYHIGGTLNLFREKALHGHTHFRDGNVLIGSSEGNSVLKLKNNRFTNANSPQPIIYCRQVGAGAKHADNFNNAIRNLVIDTGVGNSGAVGIDFRGAEGSAITDIKIYSSSGDSFFAGLNNTPGSGGSVTNLEVIGGKHGVYCPTWDSAQAAPVITAARFVGQTDLVIKYGAWTPLTLVGIEIEKAKGPVIGLSNTGHEGSGCLNLIDATINLTNPSSSAERTVIEHADRNVHIRNVYVKNVAKVVDNTATSNDSDDYWAGGADTWRYIPVFADGPHYAISNPDPSDNRTYRGRIINGNFQNGRYKQDTEARKPGSIDFLAKHGWTKGFASPTRSNVISVTAHGATPDAGGSSDDSAGIQAAINAANGAPVFMPPGTYVIKQPIQLKWNTELFGAGRELTTLDATEMWPNGGANTAVIRSNDGAGTHPSISDFKIYYPRSNRHIGGIEWRAGKKSIIRDVWVISDPDANDNDEHVRLLIEGNGGGRIYNWICHRANDCFGKDMRNVKIQNTTQPLNFYMFHNQAITPGADEPDASPKTEVINSDNINFYGIKQEVRLNTPQNEHPTSMTFVDCNNIQIATLTGSGTTRIGESLIKFIDCNKVSVSNSGNWHFQAGGPGFFYLSDWETSGGNLTEVTREYASTNLLLNYMLKGQPDFDTGDF